MILNRKEGGEAWGICNNTLTILENYLSPVSMHECVVQKPQSFYLPLFSLKFKSLWRPQCLLRAPAAPQQLVNTEVDHLQRLLEPHKRNF